MSYFTHGDDYLDYHNAGETLRIMAWGKNSLRVISVPNGPLDLSCSALLPQEAVHTNIVTGEDTVEISNGKISALIDTRGWNSAAVVTFYNDKKEVILKEIDGGGALIRSYILTVWKSWYPYGHRWIGEVRILRKCSKKVC